MSNKIINGVVVHGRGSNHKYSPLDNIDWLAKEAETKSRAEIARENNVPYNSVNYRYRYFTEEQLKKSKVERLHKR